MFDENSTVETSEGTITTTSWGTVERSGNAVTVAVNSRWSYSGSGEWSLAELPASACRSYSATFHSDRCAIAIASECSLVSGRVGFVTIEDFLDPIDAKPVDADYCAPETIAETIAKSGNENAMPSFASYIDADEIAECWSGISDSLHDRIWQLITDDAGLLSDIWERLTDSERNQIIAADLANKA